MHYAAFMAISHLLACVIHWSGFGEEGQTTYWWTGSTASHTPEQLDDFLDDWDGKLNSQESPSTYSRWQAILASPQKLDRLSVYEYDSFPGHATALAHKTINKPAGPVVALPLQVACCVTLNTARAGSSYRGRSYMPIMGQAVNVGDAQIPQATMDSVAAAWSNAGGDCGDALGSALGIGNPTSVVVSRKLAAATPITGIKIDSRPDIQRRRAGNQVPLRATNYTYRYPA